jgi:hypothetical protein
LPRLFDFERRPVGHEQELGAPAGQAGGARGKPHVLADRQTDAHAPEVDRIRERPGCEHALLVEDAIVRQFVLEAQLRASVGHERDGVVEALPGPPRKGDDEPGSAVAALVCERRQRVSRRFDEGWPEDEILRRVSHEDEL